MIGTQTDITSFRRLEEQYRQMQKMEAIGLLAGGIAHDFNDHLQIINGYAELALQGRGESDPTTAYLQEVLDTGRKASDLTRQLLAFSRQQVMKPRRLDVNDLLRNVEKTLIRLVGSQIQLLVQLEPDLPPVVADPGQLEQVVINLAVNARDAMPRGGTLHIETDVVLLSRPEAEALASDLRPGCYVRLTLSDTSVGLSTESVSKIWDPFVTIRGQQRGQGLGLATVYGVVRQSGGHVFVQSELGKGTRFRVLLPTRYTEIGALTDVPRDQKTLSGCETILLVEDDPPQRTLVAVMLRTAGYLVREAEGWPQVEAILDEGPISLLLTDIMLPELSGQEIAARVRERQPGVPVVVMTGNPEAFTQMFRHEKIHPPILNKPFSTVELLTIVRDVLDAVKPLSAESSS